MAEPCCCYTEESCEAMGVEEDGKEGRVTKEAEICRRISLRVRRKPTSCRRAYGLTLSRTEGSAKAAVLPDRVAVEKRDEARRSGAVAPWRRHCATGEGEQSWEGTLQTGGSWKERWVRRRKRRLWRRWRRLETVVRTRPPPPMGQRACTAGVSRPYRSREEPQRMDQAQGVRRQDR